MIVVVQVIYKPTCRNLWWLKADHRETDTSTKAQTKVILFNIYHVFLQQGQSYAVGLDALAAAEPLWSVVIDEPSGLQRDNQTS